MKKYILMITLLFFFSSFIYPSVYAGGEVEVGNGGSGIALALENARDVLVYVLKEKTIPPFEAGDCEYEKFLTENKTTLLNTLTTMEFEPKLPEDFNSIEGCTGRDLCIVQKEAQYKVYFRSDALYLAMVGLNHLFARLLHEAAHTIQEAKPHAFFDKFGLSVSKHLLTFHRNDPKIVFAQTLYEELDSEAVNDFGYWLEFKKALYIILIEKEKMAGHFLMLEPLQYPFQHVETLDELEKEARAFALKHIQSQNWYLNGLSTININVRQLMSVIFLLPQDASLRKRLVDIAKNTIDELCQWTLTGSFSVWVAGYDNGFWSSRPFKREWPMNTLRVFDPKDFQHLLAQLNQIESGGQK